MMVMPANSSSGVVHWMAGKYPGRIGWLLGPSGLKTPRFYLPYAMDNDAFSAYTRGVPWDEGRWLKMLKWAKIQGRPPMWVLVPDKVGDKVGTIENWHRYAPIAEQYGWPLAFAAQDGMTPSDVPSGAKVLFLGGTTAWKWSTLPVWARSFPRVHVGRVNELRRLRTCESYGVESVDGTGWLRETQNGQKIQRLLRWLDNEPDSAIFPEMDTEESRRGCEIRYVKGKL